MLPLAEFRSAQPAAVSAVAFHHGSSGAGSRLCCVGYCDGRLALFGLCPPAPDGNSSGSNAPAGVCCSAAAAAEGAAVGALLHWSVLRHASPVIATALLQQPGYAGLLVLAASRDGLLTMTHADSGRQASACQDLTGSLTPLHALVVACGAGAMGSGAVAAAAWLDRLRVFRPPLGEAAAAAAAAADVLCSWQAPEVRAAQGGAGGSACTRSVCVAVAGCARSRVLPPVACRQVPEQLPCVRSAVAFVGGGSSLLLFSSACLGPGALLYDVDAAAPLRMLRLPGSPTCIAAVPAGTQLAFGLSDGRVLLADAVCDDGEPTTSLLAASGDDAAAVSCLAYVGSGAGASLVAACGALVTVWEASLLGLS